jgi:hypothetical protein
VSPVKYELVFYIPEDDILHSHRRENLKSYIDDLASGRSCDRPTRSRFSVVFLGPRANAEFVPKFHVALLCMLHMQPFRW